MNYCSLDDAFQIIGNAPSPGCTTDYATKMARKEERRKARRCKGPAATYLDVGASSNVTDNTDKDPDRQHLNRLPIIPAMNPATGLREHVPVDAPVGSLEPFVPRNDDDPRGDYVRSEIPLLGLNVPGTTEAQKPCPGRKKWFGADADGEAFADYIPDADNYRLQPDFTSAFQPLGVEKAGSGAKASLPNPSVNMFWKPLTPSGAQTSFIEHLPPPGGEYYRPPTKLNGDISNGDIMKKLDKLWARLDDMNSSSPEQVTSELLMFISSGIFVLFMMDLLVKKGSMLRF
jgi:hypothetical protein